MSNSNIAVEYLTEKYCRYCCVTGEWPRNHRKHDTFEHQRMNEDVMKKALFLGIEVSSYQ